MTRPPILLGGIAMFWGYVKSWLSRRPQYQDKEFRRFLRRYQMSCLMRGKARATSDLNDAQASSWDPHAASMS